MDMNFSIEKNVLGTLLQPCCHSPKTGFYRDGHCHTGEEDKGIHTVCVLISDAFLDFTSSRGNDLRTKTPYFPGLKEGDFWCICVSRWKEAFDANCAPLVNLEATHQHSLEYVALEALRAHSIRQN